MIFIVNVGKYGIHGSYGILYPGILGKYGDTPSYTSEEKTKQMKKWIENIHVFEPHMILKKTCTFLLGLAQYFRDKVLGMLQWHIQVSRSLCQNRLPQKRPAGHVSAKYGPHKNEKYLILSRTMFLKWRNNATTISVVPTSLFEKKKTLKWAGATDKNSWTWRSFQRRFVN